MNRLRNSNRLFLRENDETKKQKKRQRRFALWAWCCSSQMWLLLLLLLLIGGGLTATVILATRNTTTTPPASPIMIDTSLVKLVGRIDEMYNGGPILTTGGAPGPILFEVCLGTMLPPTLMLNASSGELSGTYTDIGVFEVTFCVTDSNGETDNATISFNVAAFAVICPAFYIGNLEDDLRVSSIGQPTVIGQGCNGSTVVTTYDFLPQETQYSKRNDDELVIINQDIEVLLSGFNETDFGNATDIPIENIVEYLGEMHMTPTVRFRKNFAKLKQQHIRSAATFPNNTLVSDANQICSLTSEGCFSLTESNACPTISGVVYQGGDTNGVFVCQVGTNATIGPTWKCVDSNTQIITVLTATEIFPTPSQCSSANNLLSKQSIVRFDAGSQKWIYAFVTQSGDGLCVSASMGNSPVDMGWRSFYLDFSGRSIEDFEFGVWGETAYSFCFTDTNLSIVAGNGICYLLEKGRMVYHNTVPNMPAALPRLVQVPRMPQINPGGHPAAVFPMHRGNMPSVGLVSKFAALFVAAFPVLGEVQYMGVVIDYYPYSASLKTDLSIIVNIDPWDNGAGGSCTADKLCIPTPNPLVQLNPFRTHIRSVYSQSGTGTNDGYFLDAGECRVSTIAYNSTGMFYVDLSPTSPPPLQPFKSTVIDNLAFAFTIEANGIDNAKIQWGVPLRRRVILQAILSLPGEFGPIPYYLCGQGLQPIALLYGGVFNSSDPNTHLFTPNLAWDKNSNLYMSYVRSSSTEFPTTHVAHKLPLEEDFRVPDRAYLSSGYPATASASLTNGTNGIPEIHNRFNLNGNDRGVLVFTEVPSGPIETAHRLEVHYERLLLETRVVRRFNFIDNCSLITCDQELMLDLPGHQYSVCPGPVEMCYDTNIYTSSETTELAYGNPTIFGDPCPGDLDGWQLEGSIELFSQASSDLPTGSLVNIALELKKRTQPDTVGIVNQFQTTNPLISIAPTGAIGGWLANAKPYWGIDYSPQSHYIVTTRLTDLPCTGIFSYTNINNQFGWYLNSPGDASCIRGCCGGVFALHTTIFTAAPCSSPSNMREVRYDHEANRFIYVVISSTNDLCIAISTNSNPNSGWTRWTYTNPGSTISSFEFSIWGDYYNTCWINTSGGTLAERVAQCWVLDRTAFLAGAPSPGRVKIPDGVGVSGNATEYTVTKPTHQGASPRGPSITSNAPCGMFITAYSASGLIEQRLCTSVNFGGPSIVTSEIVTSYTPWDTTVGACTSAYSCVPGNVTNGDIPTDPIRDWPQSSYYFHTPSSLERLALIMVTNANGVDNSKLQWGEFNISPGNASIIGLFYREDPVPGTYTTGTHLFAPTVMYDRDLTLFVAFSLSRYGGCPYKITAPVVHFHNDPPGQLFVRTSDPTFSISPQCYFGDLNVPYSPYQISREWLIPKLFPMPDLGRTFGYVGLDKMSRSSGAGTRPLNGLSAGPVTTLSITNRTYIRKLSHKSFGTSCYHNIACTQEIRLDCVVGPQIGKTDIPTIVPSCPSTKQVNVTIMESMTVQFEYVFSPYDVTLNMGDILHIGVDYTSCFIKTLTGGRCGLPIQTPDWLQENSRFGPAICTPNVFYPFSDMYDYEITTQNGWSPGDVIFVHMDSGCFSGPSTTLTIRINSGCL